MVCVCTCVCGSESAGSTSSCGWNDSMFIIASTLRMGTDALYVFLVGGAHWAAPELSFCLCVSFPAVRLISGYRGAVDPRTLNCVSFCFLTISSRLCYCALSLVGSSSFTQQEFGRAVCVFMCVFCQGPACVQQRSSIRTTQGTLSSCHPLEMEQRRVCLCNDAACTLL